MARPGNGIARLLRAGPQLTFPDAHMLPVALGNLRTCFSALPDVELIAKLAGMPYTKPERLPLFLAGLQAMSHPELVSALPVNKLEYHGPWITWLGV